MLEVRISTRAEAVADSLEARIATESLPSGHHLGTKENLRRQYDVAVATMNEAVRLLSARGAISVRPGVNGGIFVASPRPLVRLGRKLLELTGESVSVADCLVIRNVLDPLILEEAARHRTAEDLSDLRGIARLMAEGDLTMTEYLRVNWALHRRIAQITPNEVLRHTYLSLLDFVEGRLHGVTADDPGRDVDSWAQVHHELVEAIGSGNIARVAAATDRHKELTTNGSAA